MTIAELLQHSGLPSIDAELLIACALQKSRTWIAAHSNEELSDQMQSQCESMMRRRREGEPVAYITGEKEFYGRIFHVTPDTLIPRPATELLVENALKLLDGEVVDPVISIDTEIVAWSSIKKDCADVKLVIDVGTGSGCIAITLACERPDLHIVATDISHEALNIAQQNAERHGVDDRISFKQGDGFAATGVIAEPFFLISNPPYIPKNILLERDVQDFEPASALFAGEKGTDVLHPLIQEANVHPLCRGWMVECREEQITPHHPSAI